MRMKEIQVKYNHSLCSNQKRRGTRRGKLETQLSLSPVSGVRGRQLAVRVPSYEVPLSMMSAYHPLYPFRHI
jgi:hypothetical protein